MKTYKVLFYDKEYDAHLCKDENATRYLVNLMVNGDFSKDTSPEDLVGKTFTADYDFPYIALAVNVKET